MKYRTNFLDYGHMFAISGHLLGRSQGIRIFVKPRERLAPRRLVSLKMTLKANFPWKRVKPSKFGCIKPAKRTCKRARQPTFGKYPVRGPSKIKAQRA